MAQPTARPFAAARLIPAPDRRTLAPGPIPAVEQTGAALFVATDTGELRRLIAEDGGTAYREDFAVALPSLIGLADGARVESMAASDGWLWVAGTRGGLFLGAIPLMPDGDGRPCPVRRFNGATARAVALPAPVGQDGVGGLAVFKDRIVLGLRGVDGNGRAVLLELAVEEDADSPDRLRLLRIGPDDAHAQRVSLPLGAGIRDLTFDGADLLIVTDAGTLWRWTGALDDDRGDDDGSGDIGDGAGLERLPDLPRPGSIARIPRAGAAPALLLPHPDGAGIDLFALPSRYDPTNSFLA